MRTPEISKIVADSLLFFHSERLDTGDFVAMPNHVHVLLLPNADDIGECDNQLVVGESNDRASPLAKIMHSLKSYTAHEANRILRRSGSFWQRESYDHWVRDDNELERIVDYIRANPVKAGLVERHEDWFFCSCHDRYLTDGDTSGWLTS